MTATGQRYQQYRARDQDCQACTLRKQCLKDPARSRGRQVTRFEPKARDPQNASERMRSAIDSPLGRRLYSQRIGTVEPVFGDIRHNKHLYCMVHNIEKLANSGWKR